MTDITNWCRPAAESLHCINKEMVQGLFWKWMLKGILNVNEGKVLSVAHLTASLLLRRHILVNTLHFLCVTSFKIKVNLYITSKMLLMWSCSRTLTGDYWRYLKDFSWWPWTSQLACPLSPLNMRNLTVSHHFTVSWLISTWKDNG